MRTKEEILGRMSLVEFNTRCLIDFKFFCEKMLGLTTYGGIQKFHMEWFRLVQRNKVSIIEAPSGFSKTEIIGVAYPLWIMYTRKKRNILLVSKTIKQAEGNILQRIKNYILDNELLKEVLVPKDAKATWNKQEIRTKNGHWCINVPYNINIKGYRAHIIILDEADSYEDPSIFFEHVLSRIVPGGKVVLISTPEGPTNLLGMVRSRYPKVGYIKTVAIVDEKGRPKKEPLEEGKSIWEERFSMEWLMEQREVMGENAFQKNYMCNILTDPEDGIFSLKSIYACFDKTYSFSEEVYPEAQYFIGADFAVSSGPKADFDAFVVVEKKDDFLVIKKIETYRGILGPVKVEHLTRLYNTYQSNLQTMILADESNMGTLLINDLRARGLTVLPQKFSHQERKKLLQVLANVIESKRLVIPRSPLDPDALDKTDALVEQLIGFVRKKSPNTGSELFLSKASHDDIVMALAMAVKEAANVITNNLCCGVSSK